VPRWLLDREVDESGLAQSPKMQHRLADLLHRALVASLHEGVGPASEAEVSSY
jgi:hypothetical protein